MTNVFFSGRIPKALSDHASEYAESLGKTKTEILIEALAQYTGFNLTTSVDNQSLPLPKLVEQLQQQIYELQKTLNTHTQKIEAIENQFIVVDKERTSVESINTLPEELLIETDLNQIEDLVDNNNNVVISSENINNKNFQNNSEPDNSKKNNQVELFQIDDYKWQPTNESAMSKLTDIGRNIFRKHREKITSGQITADNYLEGFIDGVSCSIKYCGDKGKGNLKRAIWQAIPLESNS